MTRRRSSATALFFSTLCLNGAHADDREFLRNRALRGLPACSEATCAGQPELCPLPTLGLGSSRPAGTQNHTLQFYNAAQQTIGLFWLQPNGTARAFAALAPAERKSVKSYTGDAWQAWLPAHAGASAQLMMEHVVGPAEIVDCSCSTVPLSVCPPRQPGAWRPPHLAQHPLAVPPRAEHPSQASTTLRRDPPTSPRDFTTVRPSRWMCTSLDRRARQSWRRCSRRSKCTSPRGLARRSASAGATTKRCCCSTAWDISASATA